MDKLHTILQSMFRCKLTLSMRNDVNNAIDIVNRTDSENLSAENINDLRSILLYMHSLILTPSMSYKVTTALEILKKLGERKRSAEVSQTKECPVQQTPIASENSSSGHPKTSSVQRTSVESHSTLTSQSQPQKVPDANTSAQTCPPKAGLSKEQATEKRWDALLQELTDAGAAFDKERLRLKFAHIEIRSFAVLGEAESRLVAASSAWDTIDMQAAGLRAYAEATFKVREEQVSLQNSEEKRHKAAEQAQRAVQEAWIQEVALEAAAKRREENHQRVLLKLERHSRHEERRELRKLEEIKRAVRFAELTADRRRIQAGNKEPLRCYICKLEGVKRPSLCPRAKAHWQYYKNT